MQNRLSQFSSFVGEMNARACEDSVEELARWGVLSLSRIIGFDCAWYGWARLCADAVTVEAQCPHNLPDGYFDVWSEIASEDLLAAGVWRNPGHAASYARSGDVQTDGMIALSERFDLKCMATAMDVRTDNRPAFYMSMYRGGLARPWDEDELEFLQCAVDQLSSSMRCMTARPGLRSDAASVFVNDDGVGLLGLDNLKSRLGHLLPDMDENGLPPSLRPLARCQGKHVLPDRDLVLISHRSERTEGMGLRRLTLRRLTSFDLLTRREREVAFALADGKSHKETARLLGIAPSTVRNQTQSIYAKLDVDNRAHLAAVVSENTVQMAQ
ncbi:MAG: LuxR C-terminal-related transcriptional regulator [Pseudomonadota bacterium]